MNEENLNSFALKIAKDLIVARPSIPLSVAIGVANYKMANICSQLKLQINTESGYPVTPANMYQICLLNSGGGKGASLSLVDNFYFKDAFKYISDVVYPKFKNSALNKLEEEGNERTLHSWVKSIQNVSSASGLLANAESYSLSKFGGINIELDEIGNAVISKAELFELLLQPYDNGVFDPVAKRTDPNAISVQNMNVNLYAFGNKVRLFEGDSVEKSFIQLLDEGYGRRFIFIDDTSIATRKTAEDIMREMELSDKIEKKRQSDREMIKSLITKSNMNKVMTLDREAKMKFAIIKADGDNYVLDNPNSAPAVKSDMSERNFKTVKLAGIYAFFEGVETITGRHMDEAFEVIKQSSEVLKDLRKLRPLHERLLDKMIEEPEPFTAQHMLSYSFVNSTWSKKIFEILDLSKQLASERDLLWSEVSKKGVVYYHVKEKDEESEDLFNEIDEKERREKEDMTDEQKALLEALYS